MARVSAVTDSDLHTDLTQRDISPDAEKKRSPSFDESETAVAPEGSEGSDGIGGWLQENQKYIWAVIIVIILLAYHVYLVFAAVYNLQKATTLIVLTSLVWAVIIYQRIDKLYGEEINELIVKPIGRFMSRFWRIKPLRIIVYCIPPLAMAVFLFFDTSGDRKRLSGLGGLAIFYIFMFIASTNRRKIVWRTVCWGVSLQVALGLIVLRWPAGNTFFSHFSNTLVTFMDYTNKGTTFVYGFLADPPNICGMSPVFVFTALQVIVFFGALVALLYQLGIMQVVLGSLSKVVRATLATSATESLNACACTFLGMSEGPLLIGPYMEKMSNSELHAVLTSGFSCIAGSLFSAYISFGACPSYLLSSSIMAAPGSLAVSKLLYPEEEEGKSEEELVLAHNTNVHPLECIGNGAVSAMNLVWAIAANLVVFLAILGLIDGLIDYAGQLIGHDGWNLELFLGYLFFPLAYIMGVTDPHETLLVAQLMGTKTALNEFIAYSRLGQLLSESPPAIGPRAAMIATYSLCSFANISSLGMQLGALGSLAPSRRRDLAMIGPRALMAGCISCFITATIAGILVSDPEACRPSSAGVACFNVTNFMNSQMPSTTVYPTTVNLAAALFSNKTEL